MAINHEKRREWYRVNKARIAAALADRLSKETPGQKSARNEAKARDSREFRKNFPEKSKANSKKYRQSLTFAERKAMTRRAWLKKGYGLSMEKYEAIYRSQLGACKICGGQNIAGRPLAVDHDHATGKIRGLLCQACNLILGNAKDNILTLYKAADYLEAANRLKEISA